MDRGYDDPCPALEGVGVIERQSVAGAFAKIEAHEDLCAERYTNIQSAIAEMRGWLRWIFTGVVSLLLAMLGWSLFQLYALEPLRTSQVTMNVSANGGPPAVHRGP